jgi:Ca-activated chloride channel family protein
MKLLLIASIIFSWIPMKSWALDSPQLVLENNRGAKKLEENSAVEAQNDIAQALKSNPDNAILNLNLGLSFAKQGLIEKADQSWKIAVKLAKTPEEKFYAYYNMGALSQAAKKNEEALKFYEQALAEKPNSRETKLNIELLLSQNQQQQGKGKGEGEGDKSDPSQDPSKDGEDDKKKDKDDKKYAKNPKPQPKPFKSEQLNQGDVNKILGELKQQEQRIRGEFHKADQQENPNEKDW